MGIAVNGHIINIDEYPFFPLLLYIQLKEVISRDMQRVIEQRGRKERARIGFEGKRSINNEWTGVYKGYKERRIVIGSTGLCMKTHTKNFGTREPVRIYLLGM